MLISRKYFNSYFIIVVFIFLVLAFSSCTGNVTDQSGQSQASMSPTPNSEVNSSVSPSYDSTDSSYIVLKEKLDTSKPHIVIYNAYGDITYIQLDDKTADDLNKDLSAMKETDIFQFIGTKNEYLTENIYLFIGSKLIREQTDFGNGYSVLRNSEGKMCFRDTDSGIDYLCDDACSKLVAISRYLGVTSATTNDNISSVIKAELKVNDVKKLEITDKETLEKLERMFRNAERMSNPSTFNITAVLTLTNADGIYIDIELDDVNDICIIGHTYWYDYGPGTDGDNARNSLKELFQLLGITAWHA